MAAVEIVLMATVCSHLFSDFSTDDYGVDVAELFLSVRKDTGLSSFSQCYAGPDQLEPQ